MGVWVCGKRGEGEMQGQIRAGDIEARRRWQRGSTGRGTVWRGPSHSGIRWAAWHMLRR